MFGNSQMEGGNMSTQQQQFTHLWKL